MSRAAELARELEPFLITGEPRVMHNGVWLSVEQVADLVLTLQTHEWPPDDD